MDGRVKSLRYKRHIDELYLGKTARDSVWTHELVESMKTQALDGTLPGNYGVGESVALFAAVRKARIFGKHVLVIGSENPWVEAICLAAGASHVTTLEYGTIRSEHPLVSSLLPKEFNQKYLGGTLPRFDAVVTFSSVEHSGLGRYGDALNPWGDIITIGRAWCASAPDATLTIGVMSGDDAIEFNAHRRYGSVRYPYLATNWEAFSREDNNQRIHNFRKLQL